MDRADRGKLAGVAVVYVGGVGLLLWANRLFGVGELLLLPIALGFSWATARWAWGREWPARIGLVRPRHWLSIAVLGALCAAFLLLVAGPPHVGRLRAAAWLDAFVTATFEEVISRGVLLGLLLGVLTRPLAIALSCVVFGAAHFLNLLDGGAVLLMALQVASVTGFAFVLCGLRLRSGLLVAILAHAAWNLWAFSGVALNRIAFATGPAGVFWAAAAMILLSTPFLFRRTPRPRWILCFATLAVAAAWNSWSDLQLVMRQRAALERCAAWGVNDLEDFSPIGRPRRWHWAPSARKPPSPAPEPDLDLLQQRESIEYLRHVATRDPNGRMRVAASGLLCRMADECVPRWIVEGQYSDACWSLLEAYQVRRTGGAVGGPDNYALLTLLQTVVEHDPETGKAMAEALIDAMDHVDMWVALCFANSIRQAHLDLSGFRERLLSRLRQGGEAASLGSAALLAYMGEVENRALVEKTLERWTPQSQAEDALRHLRSKPEPSQAIVTASLDWDGFRSRLADIETGWIFERTSTVMLRPFETSVIARGLFWRAGTDRLSATVVEFDGSAAAQRLFGREVAAFNLAPESRVKEAAGETAVYASGEMVMILAQRGAVYYQVNGRRADAQRLHEHIEHFLQDGEDSTK
ncbi:MAG TPA: CPBP family intramembrane glutamic endopeptidase [Planctomycetota bacterium]|nr:CPBP family intramembrane glutamic endopeptidase [Planctomycetota bacterium]